MSTLKQSTLSVEVTKNLLAGPDNLAAQVTATAAMPSTTNTMPVYDKDGNILGYVAIYANVDLT